MKIGIVGSRNLTINNIGEYLPKNCTEIVSGGAAGIDQCAKKYAQKSNIAFTEFLPMYHIYGKAAPIIRNKSIVDHSDEIIAFWNGKSKGTYFVIQYCKKVGKKCLIVML